MIWKTSRMFVARMRQWVPVQPHLHERGYTLVEVVIACGLLVGVLIPAVVFFSRVSSSRAVRDRFIAMQAAREAMEQTIGFRDYQSRETVVRRGGREWRVSCFVVVRDGFAEIEVAVFPFGSDRQIATLKTGRIVTR
jgi:type II secretory pathway component PulJ